MGYTTQDVQKLKMPPTLSCFCGQHAHLRKHIEECKKMVSKDKDLLQYNDDYVEMFPRDLIKNEDTESERNNTFCKENVCKENSTNVQSVLEMVKDTSEESSGEDEYVFMNGKNTSPLQSFNEQYYDYPRGSFSFQSRQWLNTPEKDLFLNAGFVAQSSRISRKTQKRNSLYFYWLNNADNKLFLNTAFAAKSSRRRHTR